jgi:hypothetical protein
MEGRKGLRIESGLGNEKEREMVCLGVGLGLELFEVCESRDAMRGAFLALKVFACWHSAPLRD